MFWWAEESSSFLGTSLGGNNSNNNNNNNKNKKKKLQTATFYFRVTLYIMLQTTWSELSQIKNGEISLNALQQVESGNPCHHVTSSQKIVSNREFSEISRVVIFFRICPVAFLADLANTTLDEIGSQLASVVRLDASSFQSPLYNEA